MASQNISQLRRVVFRKYNKATEDYSVFTLEPDDLGQDTLASINIAPRKKSRASSMGTTETPMPGTFDSLSASITFVADTFKVLGQALNNWTQSTYEGADTNAGQIVNDGSDICAGNEYMSVVLQGICDDGSATDIEFTRCIPSVDDDIEIGTSDAVEITLALNPVVYNAKTHADDGYGAYTYRFGDYSTTTKERLNAVSGEYEEVQPASA